MGFNSGFKGLMIGELAEDDASVGQSEDFLLIG